MRGWSITAGYDYTRIDARANRFTYNQTYAVPVGAPIDSPDDETDMVTDTRHGFHILVGERWIFDGKLTIDLRMGLNSVYKREIDVASKDPMARRNYDSFN